jgi:hypothetical protein
MTKADMAAPVQQERDGKLRTWASRVGTSDIAGDGTTMGRPVVPSWQPYSMSAQVGQPL